MELDDFINYVLLIAIAVGILFIIFGRFIDLSVERQSSDQQRATSNLMQYILSNAPFVVKDDSGIPVKSVVDRSEISASSLSECCDSLQYDYQFQIAEISGDGLDVVATISNYRDRPDYPSIDFSNEASTSCYAGGGIGHESVSQSPVGICSSGICKPGYAAIKTAATPVSQIAFWSAQACSDSSILKLIPIGPVCSGGESCIDTVTDVEITGRDICVTMGSERYCRQLTCDSQVDISNDALLEFSPGLVSATCMYAKVESSGNGVIISIPESVGGGSQ